MDKEPTRILLIEDDEEDFILLQRLLARISAASYRIIWEKSYKSGLARMIETEHDLCLMDYRLGAQNGIELVREARRRGYVLPIILLTGVSEGETDIQAFQAGADDYIAKDQLQGVLLHRIIRYAIERKKSEREREKLLSEQLAAQELEKRRNEFISIVVHELKTPLTSLKGFAQLLQRRIAKVGDEQTGNMVKRIDSQVNKLTELIDDFLDVNRISGGKLQLRADYFDFDALVEEIVVELQPITEQHTIHCTVTSQKVIWGDRTRVGQVITNLITNAIKYAPETDRILVETDVDGEAVILRVQDFGPGILPELQNVIFAPFYRIDQPENRAVTGLGLGLYISAEIIQRQHGRIWVESEKGQGATFCFSLPITQSQASTELEGDARQDQVVSEEVR